MRWFALAVLAVAPLRAAELKPQTLEAFDRYIRQTEERLASSKVFLWADELPERAQRARAGQVVVAPFHKKPEIGVPDGLIHDWVGSVFISGATLERTLALVQD